MKLWAVIGTTAGHLVVHRVVHPVVHQEELRGIKRPFF